MLGNELRQARLKAGLSQEALAHKAGLSRNYISLLELDEKSPTVETLLKICRAMTAKASSIIAKIE